MSEKKDERIIAYQEILISRILKVDNRFSYEELKKLDIDQIEILIYEHDMSTYISEEELKAFEKNRR
ncbi:hypothetical protein M2475_001474 [Breznakia sp. PF5-3]|uniref:hypothetical protein n=1 Tax=unclassified Breznakia TaxID=2623764 RepID=UPI002404E20A|nr:MULTISPECIES: hypothetical protein [unclassified Breznakia]MDF9825053.1 hypothetical protein [Breznakia sp. PM6-1]MDF9835900.1 hypothetical protein [Breznakia sp. PF5-3]MDF9837361.1 hypothetical protein [Breznakia sp. PFB2-8]MDF9859296.1 hypothetical protein [Breznakia sp. PH5-24]